MLTTRFTELAGCSIPIQLAGFAPPLLTVAVSEAGGFGMMGAAGAPLDELVRMLDDVHQRTAQNFGVNFLPAMRPVDPACLEWQPAGRDWSSFSSVTPTVPLSR